MKHILVPIRVFESGDRVLTTEGYGTVIHDEMEDFDKAYASVLSCSLESEAIEKAIENAEMRKGIFVRLDEPTCKHPNVEEDYICGREEPILQRGADK